MTLTTLGERIRDARRAAGLSQEKLAERVGVTRQAVTKWENGQSAPSTENLLRLAEVLHTPVETLLDAAADSGQTPGHPVRILSAREFAQLLRGHLPATLTVLAGWIAVYLLGRLICGDLQGSSLLGWLFGTDSRYYLFGWLTRNSLFWDAALFSVAAALFLGKWRFAAVTLAVCALAIPTGEALGKNPANAPYGHGHDGWLIWCGMWLVSIIAGIVLERMAAKGVRLRGRAGAVWLAATAAACLAVVLLCRLCVPVMTGA